jgi:hypothetical protein
VIRMVSRLKEVTMEEIPDITSDTLEKLRKLHIESVSQLAVQSPRELTTMHYLISIQHLSLLLMLESS